MNDLERLGTQLQKRSAFGRVPKSLAQCAPAVLERLEAIRQSLTPLRGHRSQVRIAQGIMFFRMAGRKTPYPDLKYACHGVAQPMDWEGRILLAETQLLAQLLAAVKALEKQPRCFSACYRGLLSAWLADIDNDEKLADTDFLRPGAEMLRQFLVENRGILAHVPRKTKWIARVLASGLEEAAALREALGMAQY